MGRSGGSEPVRPGVVIHAEFADCSKRAAVLIDRSQPGFESKDSLEVCADKRCTRSHVAVHSNRGVAALLDDESWIYAQGQGSVVGVWHQRFASKFYRLEDAERIIGITSFLGQPYLLVRPAKDVLRLVPVPKPGSA